MNRDKAVHKPPPRMSKERMAAFSDGVIAVIITIMVLELKAPRAGDWDALRQLAPGFLSYALSFLYVATYWNNHHHMLHTCEYVNGRILWANMHLLFWLSLLPFATSWLEANHTAALPVALYGVSLLMAALAYFILQYAIIHVHGPGSVLAEALGADIKGKFSLVCYVTAIAAAFVEHRLSLALYVVVAVIWFVPDKRIERALR